MKRAYWKLAVIALAALLLCGALCGCNKEPAADDTTASEPSEAVTTTEATRSPIPTYVRVDATGSVFLGTWAVNTDGTTPVTELTFNEDGSVIVSMGDSVIGGGFVVDGDQVTLNVSATAKTFTFTQEGNVISMQNENETWTLTKTA